MCFVAYFTIGLPGAICIENNLSTPFYDLNGNIQWKDQVIINGFQVDFTTAKTLLQTQQIKLTEDWHGKNISPLFDSGIDHCKQFIIDDLNFCSIENHLPNSPGLSSPNCISIKSLKITELYQSRLSFEYNDVIKHDRLPQLLVVFNNRVLDLTGFLTGNEKNKFKNVGDISWIVPGRDITLAASLDYKTLDLIQCLSNRYTIGYLGIESAGCTLNTILMVLAILIVMGVILARFFMAFIFHWFIAPRISSSKSKLGKSDILYLRPPPSMSLKLNDGDSGPLISQDWRSLALPTDLYTLCLITCYSEDELSIRNTLDAIAGTDFPDERKLLFVICDGLIQGEGNEHTTPDIVLSMVEKDPQIKHSDPMDYLAIADGEKQHNMARVV
jgi:chitin synthase